MAQTVVVEAPIREALYVERQVPVSADRCPEPLRGLRDMVAPGLLVDERLVLSREETAAPSAEYRVETANALNRITAEDSRVRKIAEFCQQNDGEFFELQLFGVLPHGYTGSDNSYGLAIYTTGITDLQYAGPNASLGLGAKLGPEYILGTVDFTSVESKIAEAYQTVLDRKQAG